MKNVSNYYTNKKIFLISTVRSPDDGWPIAGGVLVAGLAAAALRGAPGPGRGRIPSSQRLQGLVQDGAPLKTILAGVGHQQVTQRRHVTFVVLSKKIHLVNVTRSLRWKSLQKIYNLDVKLIQVTGGQLIEFHLTFSVDQIFWSNA